MREETTLRHRAAVIAVATVTSSLALVACHGKSSSADGGDDSSSSSSAAGAAKSAVTVDVKDFAFKPGTVTVKSGGKVTWKFEDDADHNVEVDKLKKKSPDLAGGKTYSLTFNKAGSYDYLCTIHQYMKAKVIVK